MRALARPHLLATALFLILCAPHAAWALAFRCAHQTVCSHADIYVDARCCTPGKAICGWPLRVCHTAAAPQAAWQVCARSLARQVPRTCLIGHSTCMRRLAQFPVAAVPIARAAASATGCRVAAGVAVVAPSTREPAHGAVEFAAPASTPLPRRALCQSRPTITWFGQGRRTAADRRFVLGGGRGAWLL